MTEKVAAHHTSFIPLHFFKSENSQRTSQQSSLSSVPQLYDLSWSFMIYPDLIQGAGCGRTASGFIPYCTSTPNLLSLSPCSSHFSEPSWFTAEIPEFPYQGEKSHTSHFSGQTLSFPPFIIFGISSQFPNPLPIKKTNRTSITNSLSSWYYSLFWVQSHLLIFLYHQPLFLVLQCSKHPQTWFSFSSSFSLWSHFHLGHIPYVQC